MALFDYSLTRKPQAWKNQKAAAAEPTKTGLLVAKGMIPNLILHFEVNVTYRDSSSTVLKSLQDYKWSMDIQNPDWFKKREWVVARNSQATTEPSTYEYTKGKRFLLHKRMMRSIEKRCSRNSRQVVEIMEFLHQTFITRLIYFGRSLCTQHFHYRHINSTQSIIALLAGTQGELYFTAKTRVQCLNDDPWDKIIEISTTRTASSALTSKVIARRLNVLCSRAKMIRVF